MKSVNVAVVKSINTAAESEESMKKSKDLISAIKKLEKAFTHEIADNMLASIMLVNKGGYFEVLNQIDRFVSEKEK